MSSLRQDEPAHLEGSDAVGVERATEGASPTAHAISPAMVSIGQFGLARCGFPVEHLTLVPELDWQQLQAERRCEHCAADAAEDKPTFGGGRGIRHHDDTSAS